MQVKIDLGTPTATGDALRGASTAVDQMMLRKQQLMRLEAEAEQMELARNEQGRLNRMSEQSIRSAQSRIGIEERASEQDYRLTEQRETDRREDRSRGMLFENEDRTFTRDQRQRVARDDQREEEDRGATMQSLLMELRRAGATPAEMEAAADMKPERLQALVTSRRMARHQQVFSAQVQDAINDAYMSGDLGPVQEGPTEPGAQPGYAEAMRDAMLTRLELDPAGAQDIADELMQVQKENARIAATRASRAARVESMLPMLQQLADTNPEEFAEAQTTLRQYVSGAIDSPATVMQVVGRSMWLSDMNLTRVNEMAGSDLALRDSIIREIDAVHARVSTPEEADKKIRTMVSERQMQTARQAMPATLALPLGKSSGGGHKAVDVNVPQRFLGQGRSLSKMPQDDADALAATEFWKEQARMSSDSFRRGIAKKHGLKNIGDEATINWTAFELMQRYGGWNP